MPRPTFADPRNDFVFRRIFGSEERRDVLVAFLHDMLALDQAHRILSMGASTNRVVDDDERVKAMLHTVKCYPHPLLTHHLLKPRWLDRRVAKQAGLACFVTSRAGSPR